MSRGLLELHCGKRTIGGHLAAFRHLVEGRLADSHRVFEVLALHGPSAVVAAAAIHEPNRHAGYRLQGVAGAEADVLSLQVTGNVVGDGAG